MAKIFYDHLTVIEEIDARLAGYKLSSEEREDIIRLADETMHTEVLNIILTRLPKEKHHQFLTHLSKSPEDPQILEFLKSEVADIEEEISQVAKKVKKEIAAEIKRASSLRDV